MAINKAHIIQEMAKIHVQSNQQGVIPAFNVYIQQLPIDFWNGFARRIINYVPEDLIGAAEALLINAAHECGYHTGYGIIHSPEWKKIIAPMIQTPEDTIHAIFAVLTAWGWAKSNIIELQPAQKLILHADNYYESDVVRYGRTTRPCAYMIQGICAAFMDLIYGQEYPHGINTFQCQQTKGLELGDDYGEFIVTPQTSN